MNILPSNLQTQYNLYEIPKVCFTELEQVILKFVWKHTKDLNSQTILRKEKKVTDIILPNFKLYWKATVTKAV